jgi:hypothetical protein
LIAGWQRLPGRHLAPVDVFPQPARLSLARYQDVAVTTAREDFIMTAEIESALWPGPAVAVEAALDEERRDSPVKIRRSGRRFPPPHGLPEEKHQQRQQGNPRDRPAQHEDPPFSLITD